jgi:hypothetical protein
MLAFLRYGLLAIGGLMLALTAGFFWQMPWAVSLWPWPESRLSYIFLASIAASIAAASIWTAISEEYGALRSQATNTIVTTAGIAVTAFFFLPSDGSTGTLLLGIVSAVLCLLGVGTWLLIRHYPIKDPRPLPGLVRISFAFFTTVLILVGGAMVLGAQVFPWPLKPGSCTVYGWIFLGAATYFLYPVLQPSWHNARAQLWGFLAYDVVLIVPFLGHFERVAPARLSNLIIYVAVLVYSGALAIYYLFINPITRPAMVQPTQVPSASPTTRRSE